MDIITMGLLNKHTCLPFDIIRYINEFVLVVLDMIKHLGKHCIYGLTTIKNASERMVI